LQSQALPHRKSRVLASSRERGHMTGDRYASVGAHARFKLWGAA